MKKILLFIMIFSLTLTASNSYATTGSIYGPDVVYKDTLSILTINQILELFNYNNEKLEVISDAYTGFGDIVNDYQVTIKSTPSNVMKTFKVSVLENLSPKDSKGNPIIFAVSKSSTDIHTIYITKNNFLTSQQITNIAVNLNMIRVLSTSGVQELKNEYKENENKPGKYLYEFRVVDRNGQQQYADFDIVVTDFESFNPDFVIGDDSVSFKNILIYSLSSLIIITILILVFNKKRKV